MAGEDGDRGPSPADTKRRLSRRDLLRRLVGETGQRPGASVSGFDTLTRRADQLARDQQYDAASELYQRIIDREPIHPEAWRCKGWCLMRLGRHAEAREAWRTLLRSGPGDGHAVLYTGMSHALEGDIESALEVWRTYRDYNTVLIMREINLILHAASEGEPLEGESLACRIEDAIRRQEQPRR